MSVEELWPIGPAESMEVLPTWEGVMHEAGEREEEEEEEGGKEASSSKSSSDESDGSEPEPPRVIRRKVSFADAFGLDLVSVKEFDSAVFMGSKVAAPSQEEAAELEEYFLSCLFSVPSSSEELDERLRQQMVELESVELLPGTTTLRGIIRVVNLCYSKTVYVRISLDGWRSHFDLLAEYIPGSSDGETDRFSFKLTLVPPVNKEGTRVELCLRYDTFVGTFWANNKDLNYVLFCHRRVKEGRVKEPEEWNNHRSKRSCLKSHRKSSPDEPLTLIPTPDTAVTGGAEKPVSHTLDSSAEIHASVHQHQPLVDSQKRRRREDRLAQVEDYFCQNQQDADQEVNLLKDIRKDAGLEALLHPLRGGTSSMIHLHHRKNDKENTPQILTYHQIPLLTLDWSGDKSRRSGGPEENREGLQVASEENMSVSDLWEAFLKDTDCKDNSSESESESVWLQTATLVGPSNNKEDSQSWRDISQEEVAENTHTGEKGHAHINLQSSNSHVTLETREHDSSGCQRTAVPGCDNMVCHDTTKKSEAILVTDTLQECSLALLISGERRAEVDQKGREGVRQEEVESRDRPGEDGKERSGVGRGGEGGEAVSPHTAWERRCTEDTTEEGWLNDKAAGDKISLGERQGQMLCLGTERGVTGTGHKAARDSVTFTETIRDNIEAGGSVTVTHTSGEEGGATRQGEKEVHHLNQPEKKPSLGCQEIDAGEDHRSNQSQTEEFRLCQSNTDEVNPLEAKTLSQPCTAVQTDRLLDEVDYLRTDQSAQRGSQDDVEMSSVGTRPNQSNEDQWKISLLHSQTGAKAHKEKLRPGTGEERDCQAGDRGGEESASEENSKMVEVKNPMKGCESVQRERGDVSAEKQNEQKKATMEKVEGSRQVENEKLSEGTKECSREVDWLSLGMREEREEEGYLGEGALEEVLHLHKAMEELVEGGTREEVNEETCDTVYQKPQVNLISTTAETGTISDTAQTSPAPLIAEPKDILFSLSPFISSSVPRSVNSPVSLPPPVLPSLSPSISPFIPPSVSISTASIPPSCPPSPSHPLSIPPSERVSHPARSVLTRCSVFHSVDHMTRVLVYTLLVFLCTTLLCDFPACFAVYASLWWWNQSDSQEATVVEGTDHTTRLKIAFRSETD